MDSGKRFMEYAAAFEQTYADDDWTRLEPYFTEDAIYRVSEGPPLGGEWRGRDALLAGLQNSVNTLDRRFESRRTELVGAPTIEATQISFSWRGIYSTPGLPDLAIGGIEFLYFNGDRIKLMEDRITPGDDLRAISFLKEHLGVSFES